MKRILHITSGDMAGELLAKSTIPGEVFVWHDILYDGPRKPGWPDDATLDARAGFLEDVTGGGISKQDVFDTLKAQYAKLKTASEYDSLVLWFDACLFDQSMLCHILACMRFLGNEDADLLCIDAFPGIEPYHGLGQLSPDQLASMYSRRQQLTSDHFVFAERVDRAFARQDKAEFIKLSKIDAPLPWIPAAVTRWMEESPDKATGLGKLEKLALEAIRSGVEVPHEIFSFVAARDEPPQYWGDITLWQKINALADREPPLIKIEGPNPRLPQWEDVADLKLFRVLPNE
nr:hypothetical protein [uncultured Desulfobacter sp.]